MTETLSAWERVTLARHPQRPHTLHYIQDLLHDFVELHGDRLYADDPAIVGGIGYFNDWAVVVIGHQKGETTQENVRRNFGMPHPEGYRKAERLMQLAERFTLPLITFIDTPAADPGLGSEERGQAWAISSCLQTMAALRVPIVTVVIGEGGSGGALAISVADRILMLENAVYTVASPEACASILWRDPARAPEAATALRLTAADLAALGIIDEVIPEPVPAHEAPHETIQRVGAALARHLHELCAIWTAQGYDALLAKRYQKYRQLNYWELQSANASQ